MTPGDQVRLRSPDPQKFRFDKPAGPWQIEKVTQCPATGRDVYHLSYQGDVVRCWSTDIEPWEGADGGRHFDGDT